MHALHQFLLLHVLTCVGQNTHGSEIIHGKKAPEHSMLYMVSVQNSDKHHVCGGFLISENFVLTAAHCDDPNPSVVIGTHNLKKADDSKRYSVTKFKHPSYDNVGNGNDIMLFKLSSNVGLNNRVQTIPLPTQEGNTKENEECSVAGWGYTEPGETERRMADELRVVNVSIIKPSVCQEAWNGLPANVICAGGYHTNKGFCQGDSGGPLVCKGVAVGIVSFNHMANCNYPHYPNVYTDISKYLSWIKEILKKNN